MDQLVEAVSASTSEIRVLRTAVDSRVSREESEYRRRRITVSLIVYGLLIIWGHDAHVEHCGPGSRAEAVIQAIARNPAPTDGTDTLTLEKVKQIIDAQQTTPLCDATFPFHAHDEGGYPGPWAVLGFGIYAVVFGLLGWYLYSAYRAFRVRDAAEHPHPHIG